VARRRRAERFYACGALSASRAARSTRTLGVMRSRQTLGLLFVFVVAGGCAGPSGWSKDRFSQLQCEMSEAQVSTLMDGRSERLSGTRADGTTHLVYYRSTYIKMAMPNGRLQSADLCWDYAMKAVACAQTPRLRCDGHDT
jgi:hypothetical protein